MLRRDSDTASLATGESISRVNSQHDPKTVQMDLMMGPTWTQNGIKTIIALGRTLCSRHNIAYCSPPPTPHNLRWANASSYVKLPSQKFAQAKEQAVWEAMSWQEHQHAQHSFHDGRYGPKMAPSLNSRPYVMRLPTWPKMALGPLSKTYNTST